MCNRGTFLCCYPRATVGLSHSLLPLHPHTQTEKQLEDQRVRAFCRRTTFQYSQEVSGNAEVSQRTAGAGKIGNERSARRPPRLIFAPRPLRMTPSLSSSYHEATIGIERKREEEGRKAARREEQKRVRKDRESSNFSFNTDSGRGIMTREQMTSAEEGLSVRRMEGGNVPHAVSVCSIILLIFSELLEWLNIYYRTLRFHHDYLESSDEQALDGHVRSFHSLLPFLVSSLSRVVPFSVFFGALLTRFSSIRFFKPCCGLSFSHFHVVNRNRISFIILSRD